MSENREHEVIRTAPVSAIVDGPVNPAPNIAPAALAQRLSRYADELTEVGRAYSAALLRAAACTISELLKAEPVNTTTVPDRKDECGPNLSNHLSYNSGWNACRAAMLASRSQPAVQRLDLPAAAAAAGEK